MVMGVDCRDMSTSLRVALPDHRLRVLGASETLPKAPRPEVMEGVQANF